MAKIAAELIGAVTRRLDDGTPGRMAARTLGRGDGWSVHDVVCTAGPPDRPYAERHASVAIALVAAGTFQYRSAGGTAVMTPGSLLLGNAGSAFECGHEHGFGDRCVAFHFSPDVFERLAADAGVPASGRRFRGTRLPPLRPISALSARACAGLHANGELEWSELAFELAAETARLAGGIAARETLPPGAAARVSPIARRIAHEPGGPLALADLAREAGLSPYHFLRTFQRVTGVTPHQYVLRMRLRQAALRLAGGEARILDVAFDCGFGDLSNFNRAFRREFGVRPGAYRRPSLNPRSTRVPSPRSAARRRTRA